MNRGGQELRGTLAAGSVRELRDKLLGQDYLLLEAAQAGRRKDKGGDILARLLPVRNKDRAVFAWQLYTMVEAGIPVTRALETVATQTKHPRLQSATRDVVEAINNGLSFSEALRRHPRVFPSFLVHMVEVGEVGGVLDDILCKAAEYFETQVERRARVVSAISYPLVLVVGCIGILLFLVMFLVPRLFVLFDNMGARMPTTTLILISVARFLRAYWAALALGLAALVVAWKLYTRRGPWSDASCSRGSPTRWRSWSTPASRC
jgi:type IV pilus assembly protein PilC